MTWEGRKRHLNSGKLNCLMSYRSQSLIDINRTFFSSGASEVPRWFVATVERGGSGEIDQPTMSLTFWQSVLVKTRPCPPQFLRTLFPMFLLWVLVQSVGAIWWLYQARWVLSPWGCKTKSQNWRIQILLMCEKIKELIDIRTAIIQKNERIAASKCRANFILKIVWS